MSNFRGQKNSKSKYKCRISWYNSEDFKAFDQIRSSCFVKSKTLVCASCFNFDKTMLLIY